MKYKTIVQTVIFISALLLVGVFYLLINIPSSVVTPQSFSISKGESLRSIAERLEQTQLISSRFIFQFYIKMTSQAKNIKAGYYFFPAYLSINNITQRITDNHILANGNFLIKEGETLKEIENNLQQKGILLSSQNLNHWQIKDFSSDEYSALFQNVALDNSLEGYLFPDSYHLSQGLSEKEIINSFLNNFSKQLAQVDLFQQGNFQHNFYENLIMASILEKEVRTEIDKRMVADILWRRLKENFPLQIDASICYAQNQSFIDCQLTEKAFKIDSQYNTYLYKGLPPSPISNPGLESIKAALNPLSNQSWYYLTDRKTGKTIYSETYEDHIIARDKYLK
ncbi:MAG: endolytic transglycosylase MltG [Candidatus Paceibacterota bacterium]|jgi:UPF0755 protein